MLGSTPARTAPTTPHRGWERCWRTATSPSAVAAYDIVMPGPAAVRAWRPSRTGTWPRSAPGSYSTVTPAPSRSRSPASGVTVRCGVTLALPPPCTTAVAAFGPITATRCSAPVSRGRTRSPATSALRSRTMDAAEVSRASSHRSGSSTEVSGRLDEVGAHPVEEPQQPAGLLRDHVARDLPGLDRGGQRGPEVRCGSGHLEVEPREGRRHGGVGGEPVRHHEPVEAPLLPQDRRQEPRVLAAERAVDAVVRRHDGPDAAVAHGGLEGAQVDLAQRPLVDVAADRVPFDLGVVGHEVLGAGRDAPALHPPHEADHEASRQRRILAVALEVPSSQRVSDQVDRRTEQHVGRLGAGLVGDGRAHPLDQPGIEGGAERRAAREQGRRGRRVALAPRPDRTVGHLEARHTAFGQTLRVPVVLAGGEGGLLLEGEVVHEVLVAIGHRL